MYRLICIILNKFSEISLKNSSIYQLKRPSGFTAERHLYKNLDIFEDRQKNLFDFSQNLSKESFCH